MRNFTVKTLHQEIGELLSGRYGSILVEGEVSQIQVPASGHCYLVLRESDDSLSAVAWRGVWRQIGYKPKQGDRVVCRGRIGVYGPRGTYQLYVTEIQPAGQGDLAKEIEARKARLMADGLLDPRRKRPLPAFPRIIGVATSLTGAALQDFLKVSGQRFPAARIVVAPCQVQGEAAPRAIVQALDLLCEYGDCEVIVVTRGGGSKEDLLAFADETLARCIAACPVPVVSAVGHQVDTTLADLVADAVAPTPSAAAMLVCPDGPMLSQKIDDTMALLLAAMQRRLDGDRERVQSLSLRLRHPGQRLTEVRLRMGELEKRLRLSVTARVLRSRQELERSRVTLHALSPTGVLQRGYAIVRGEQGVITSSTQVRTQQRLGVRVAEGEFLVEVVPTAKPVVP